MNFRVCLALLLLLAACATTEPRQQKQVGIPWAPLAAPKPVAPVLPAPVGLMPPAPIMVDPGAQPTREQEVDPESERSSTNRGPPAPLTSGPRPECTPRPVPHLGGDALHNQCADRIPRNGFPGSDVLVDGKRFDALQLAPRTLWEVKTDNFDTYSPFLRRRVVENQLPELQRERELARGCGFEFRVGVRSAAHKAELEFADDTLEIVVMDWC